MAYNTHFLIPFASSLDPACQAAIKMLQLPNLTRFLKQADIARTDQGDEFDFIPPHERAIAASVRAELVDAPLVVVTPCQWSVGIDNIRMDNPDDLQLTDAESRALFATVQPYFSEDGIELTYDSPLRWLAQSQTLQGLALASLDRVIGRNVDVWQPQSSASKAIRRLQNEMQMLLYTHPLNEAREARGLPTVNSFWLSRSVAASENVNLIVDNSLREPAMRGDWNEWSHAWETISKKLPQAQPSAGQYSKGLQVILCGERHSICLTEHRPIGMMQKIKRLFQEKPTVQSVLESL